MKTLKQAKEKNEQEKAIDTYLESIGVKFSVIGRGVGLKRDGWECDGWNVVFQKGNALHQLTNLVDHLKGPDLSEGGEK